MHCIFWVKRAEIGENNSGFEMNILSGSNSARAQAIRFTQDDELEGYFSLYQHMVLQWIGKLIENLEIPAYGITL